MKEATTAIGRDRIGISAERKWNKKMTITMLTMMAEAPNHVCRPAHFKKASTKLVRPSSNSFDDRREWDSVSAQFVGVHVDLILAHESTNGGYLGNSGNRF